jgi:hypothetical protein
MKANRSLWLLPRIQDIFFIGIFLAVLSLGQRMLNLDGDLPRHLLMGNYILQNHSIPTSELFIYPYRNEPYIPHEWLTDVLFSLIFAFWKLPGIVAFAAVLMASTFTLLYSKLSNRLHFRLPVLILVAWGMIATSLNWAARPHLVSMFLLAVWLLWTDDLRRGQKIPIWRFPLTMLLWSNLHGEFIAGMLVLLAYAAGWTLDYLFDRSRTNLNTGRNIWLALIFSAITSVINPSGLGPWISILGFVNNEYLMSRMLEANAPNFQSPEMRVLLGLLALSIFLLAIKRERLSTGQALLLAGFSAMSLIATRNIHLYGIVAPFVLAETLDKTRNFPLIDRLESSLQSMEGGVKGFAWIVTSAIVLSSIAVLNDKVHGWYQFREPVFPVRAVEWVEDHPQQGNMFNELNWGGYIAFHLWPDELPFIDSMADTSGQVTRQYEAVITLQEGWHDVFQDHSIEWAMIPPRWPLAQELSSLGWETVYQDPVAIIFVKR